MTPTYGSYSTGGTYTTATTTMWTPTTSTASTLYYTDDSIGSITPTYGQKVREVHIPVPVRDLVPGKQYDLPDGAVLSLDAHGNYTIVDHAAKVIYKANRIREFNPYINASDLLEDFIRDMGQHGVRQSELLGLPVNIFIHWLILKAAEKDGDDLKDVTPPQRLLSQRRHTRCLCCGRYLPHHKLDHSIFFCSPDHLSRYSQRLTPALPAPQGGFS
jgi:hypothetical protein